MTKGIRCRMYTDKLLIKVLSNVENYPRQVLNVLCLDITTTSLEWYPCKEFWQWVSSKRGCSCGLQDSNCVKGDRIFCQLSAKFHHIMAIWTLICFKGSSLIHWSWKKKTVFWWSHKSQIPTNYINSKSKNLSLSLFPKAWSVLEYCNLHPTPSHPRQDVGPLQTPHTAPIC